VVRGGAAAAYEEYSFDGNKLELSSLQNNDKISDNPFVGRRHNTEPDTPSTTNVLFKDPPAQVLFHEPELDTMPAEISPVWKKYVNQYSDGIVSFTLYIAGVCEPEFYVRDYRQLMIIIMMPTVVSNAREVFEQPGLGCGDHSHCMFYTNLQATMDGQRKQ
jgi:hypothetical protein